MSQLVEYLFGVAPALPHGDRLLWRSDLVTIFIVADGLMAVACLSIPAAIMVFVRRRPDMEYRWLATLFALFILACGVTYLIDMATLWQPAYGLQGLARLVAGVAAAIVALALWPILPQLVALPTAAELRGKNAALEAEIELRRAAELELRRAHDRLEERVLERTKALEVANAALRQGEERLALALDAADAGLIDIDLCAGIATHSPRARQILALPAQAPASALSEAAEEGDRDELMAGLDALRAGSSAKLRSECRWRRRDGGQAWVGLALKTVERDDHGAAKRAVGICLDVTPRKEAEQRLAHLAMYDSLTGLPNRTLFQEMLQREQARGARFGSRFALLLADLNGFKQVNDRLGHAAGDMVLAEVARRLAEVVRDSDMVARYGGDEFAILAGEPSSEGALRALAERIVAAVEAPVAIGQDSVRIGVSIGAAVRPYDGRDLDLLFARADAALYAVKAGGRSGMRRFETAMVQRDRPTAPLVASFVHALGL